MVVTKPGSDLSWEVTEFKWVSSGYLTSWVIGKFLQEELLQSLVISKKVVGIRDCNFPTSTFVSTYCLPFKSTYSTTLPLQLSSLRLASRLVLQSWSTRTAPTSWKSIGRICSLPRFNSSFVFLIPLHQHHQQPLNPDRSIKRTEDRIQSPHVSLKRAGKRNGEGERERSERTKSKEREERSSKQVLYE